MRVNHPNRSRSACLLTLFFSLFTLSGCALNPGNQQTLQAIDKLDTGLQQRLQMLEQQTQHQNEQLSQLQLQIQSNKQTLARLTTNQQKLLTLTENRSRKAKPELLTEPDPNQQGKVVLGSKEWVWLDAAAQNFRARVDSGATTSSMHAPDPVFFERNGSEWVRFSLPGAGPEATTDDATPRMIEAPVVRWVRIIQASSDVAERRPVIEAWIQVGGLREKAEFTLADRANMTFPILLGREFFKDVALIDVGKSYIHPKPQPPQGNAAPETRPEQSTEPDVSGS